MRTRILDSLACIPLFSGKDEFLRQADDWSLHALEIEPSSLTLKGTRGGVLVELGRIEEGKQLLEDCFKNSASVNDKSISACYLALAASKQGDTQRALDMLELARNVNPQCVVLLRITERVTGSRPSGN
jgi:predicted Zn-dependent protease